jgi:PAS domain S-box-containing protein
MARFIYDAAGHPMRMIGVNVDIDGRKRVEHALRQTEEQFRTLADNMSQFAWMADDQGWIFWYNRRWYEYTGTTLDQVKGWGWTRVHHPEHVERVVSRIQRSWDSGEPWEDTFPLRGKDDEYRWYLSRANPIRGADGRVARWFGTHTDVTNQLEAEEALREAGRRKDEFLATLAHELRNPLAPMRNMLEILKQSDNEPVLLQKARETMERQLTQMVRLVDDLLDVSRITRNKLSLQRQPVDLESIVTQAIETCRPLLDRNRHELDVTLPQAPIWLNGDAVRLAQVFGNLLNNACKYTPAGGRISLVARVEGEDAIVSVKDNGVGIPKRMLSNIFDMFTQVDRSLERSTGGLGIGLTLVQQLVKMHDGQVEVSSDGPGQGSEFTVRLPLGAILPDELPEPQASPSVSAPGHRRILVVDDNKDSADSLAMLLKLTGHDSHVAHDGLQAVELAERLRPGVIVLDIGLPRLNGYDACRRIRETAWGGEVVMIALTGWGQEEDRKRSKEAGFDYHIVKPVDHVELMRLLGSLYGNTESEVADASTPGRPEEKTVR